MNDDKTETETQDAPPPKAPRPRLLTAADLGIDIEMPDPHVWSMLSKIKRGRGEDAPLAADNTPLNLRLIFSMDPRWRDNVRFNEFDGSAMVHVPDTAGAVSLSTPVSTSVVVWLERVYGLRTTEERVGRSITEVAFDVPYHPVREYLRSVVWDGNPRVRRLLAGYFGAADSELHEHLSRCWMLSAVARVMLPGCKVDTTLILVGNQGAKKSMAIRALAGDWSADTLLDLGSKDLYESIHGVWLYELAELDAFRKAEWPKIKAILSSPRDRYRRPYAAAAEPRDRQCIFIGTTNDDRFLGDPSGSRRFWPVRVGERVDLAALKRDRDQLWAEALYLYMQGQMWWLDDVQSAALAKSSEDFQDRHGWHDLVIQWLPMQAAPFTIADVLIGACRKDPGSWSAYDSKLAGGILRELGYEPSRSSGGGRRVSVWSKVSG